MDFFNNIFNISDDDYYGVSGLNTELSCIYVYNTFLKYNKGMVVVTNSLFEANLQKTIDKYFANFIGIEFKSFI